MANKRRKSVRAEIALVESLMLAPLVVVLRMPILVAEATGSLLSGRPESVGAVYEKVSLLAEGMVAAQLAIRPAVHVSLLLAVIGL